MVPEVAVLLGVEDLQERRGGVATVVPAELVDLVNQDHGVRALRELQTLDQFARHGADVRTAVPADLRDVVHAADGEPEELPVQGPGDALADGGLADARRPREAHDLPLHRRLQEADGDVLQDPLLDVLEPEVVLVEDVLRPLDVLVLLSELAPREAREPLQVRPADIELRRGGLQCPELRELGIEHLGGLGRQLLVFDRIPELREQGLLLVLVDAQLLHNLIHLRSQHDPPLLLRDLLLGLVLHLRLELGELQVLLRDREHLSEARQQLVLREDALQVLPLRQGHAGDQVGEPEGLLEVIESHDLLELLAVNRRGP
mmetsp:Transcript_23009/g.69181  ORF Transcript_23009/g.69181 Transcript_23009/m.69181 type:complete len:317 (+) Transcript_23009:1110-2060(+)